MHSKLNDGRTGVESVSTAYTSGSSSDSSDAISRRTSRERSGEKKLSKSDILSSLVDITNELELLKEIKDIRDELNIISTVFIEQQRVLKELIRFMPRAVSHEEELARAALHQIVDNNLRDARKRDQHAKQVYDTVSIF